MKRPLSSEDSIKMKAKYGCVAASYWLTKQNVNFHQQLIYVIAYKEVPAWNGKRHLGFSVPCLFDTFCIFIVKLIDLLVYPILQYRRSPDSDLFTIPRIKKSLQWNSSAYHFISPMIF